MRIATKAQKLKLNIIMSRDSSGMWSMTIEDSVAGLIIVSAKMNDEQFSDFMSHRYAKIDGEHYANPNIGKKMVTKWYDVNLEKLKPIFENYDDASRARDMKHIFDLAEQENPGFKADRESYNSHRNNRGYYQVTLRKWEDV